MTVSSLSLNIRLKANLISSSVEVVGTINDNVGINPT